MMNQKANQPFILQYYSYNLCIYIYICVCVCYVCTDVDIAISHPPGFSRRHLQAVIGEGLLQRQFPWILVAHTLNLHGSHGILHRVQP